MQTEVERDALPDCICKLTVDIETYDGSWGICLGLGTLKNHFADGDTCANPLGVQLVRHWTGWLSFVCSWKEYIGLSVMNM